MTANAFRLAAPTFGDLPESGNTYTYDDDDWHPLWFVCKDVIIGLDVFLMRNQRALSVIKSVTMVFTNSNIVSASYRFVGIVVDLSIVRRIYGQTILSASIQCV